MVYKIVRNLIDLPFEKFFTFKVTNYNLRRHKYHLEAIKFDKNVRKYFFSTRIVKTWNDLPRDIVMSENLQTFKIKLKKFDLSEIYKFPRF